MKPLAGPSPLPERRPHLFATTQWSLVASAAQPASPEASQALTTLCESYWSPLYTYVRRRGYDEATAQDLTQEFFARLLDNKLLGVADPQRGKFRSFLLSSFRHFLLNEWRDAQAQKRGGGRAPLSLDFARAEKLLDVEPVNDMTPERLYDRRWAMALLERTWQRLEREYEQAGKAALFQELRGCLGGEAPAPTYRQIAERLFLTEGAVKVAAHRLRARCRDLLRAEIADTVATPAEVEEELRDLFQAVGATS